MEKYIDGTKEYYHSHSDLLSDEYLKEIILNEKFINTIKSILGENIVYFGESCWTCSHGKTSPMEYHTDNSDRNSFGKDWEVENYPIIRFAFYLQDHSKSGGGPIIGLKTHKKFIKNLYLRVLYREILGPILGRFKHINYEIGDLIIWNLRTTHAGDGLRFKKINFPISKRLNRYIPEFLISRCYKERFLINGNFALESSHLNKYINYLHTRSYQVKDGIICELKKTLKKKLKDIGVKYLDFSDSVKEKINNNEININKLNVDHYDYK